MIQLRHASSSNFVHVAIICWFPNIICGNGEHESSIVLVIDLFNRCSFSWGIHFFGSLMVSWTSFSLYQYCCLDIFFGVGVFCIVGYFLSIFIAVWGLILGFNPGIASCAPISAYFGIFLSLFELFLGHPFFCPFIVTLASFSLYQCQLYGNLLGYYEGSVEK